MYVSTMLHSGSLFESGGSSQNSLASWVCGFWMALGFGCLLAVPPAVSRPADELLSQASITRVDGVVEIFEDAEGQPQAARIGEVIKDKRVLKTGDASKAELEFKDTTLSRLGSHTIFTFDQTVRELKLQKGSMLLQVFKDEGACRIVTPVVSAAILEATVIVEIRDSGDTSLFLLETGKEKGMEVTSTATGKSAFLLPGECATVDKADGKLKVELFDRALLWAKHELGAGMGSLRNTVEKLFADILSTPSVSPSSRTPRPKDVSSDAEQWCRMGDKTMQMFQTDPSLAGSDKAMSKLDEAIAKYEGAITRARTYAKAWEGLGHALEVKFAIRNKRGVVGDKRDSSLLDPNFKPDPKLYTPEHDATLFAAATNAFIHATVINPDIAEAWYGFGRVLLGKEKVSSGKVSYVVEQKQRDEAIKVLRKAVESKRTTPRRGTCSRMPWSQVSRNPRS